MKKLVLGVLFFGLLFRAGLISWRSAEYWYDEVIVTSISKQEPDKMWDTILSEPHPPGFYIFLKQFSVDNPTQLRLRLLVWFGGITLGGLLWVFSKKKLFEDCAIGITIFLMSFGFLWSGVDVKQAIISVPLWMWWFWMWLYSLDNKLNSKEEVLWGVLGAAIVWTDYRLLVAMLVILGVKLFSGRKVAHLATVMWVISLVAVMYWVGIAQIWNNVGRFGWTVSRDSSMFVGIVSFFVGRVFEDWSVDLMQIITNIWLVVSGWVLMGEWKKNTLGYKFWLVVGGLVLAFLYMGTRAFVMVRYAMPLYLVICLVLGFGISWVLKSRVFGKKIWVVWSMMMFGIGGIAGAIAYNPGWFGIGARQALMEIEKPTGFITDHPNYSLVYLSRFPELKNMFPVSVYDDVGVMDDGVITKDVLALEGKMVGITEEKIEEALRRTRLDSFAYLLITGVEVPFDESKKTLTVLTRACDYGETKVLGNYTSIMVWKNCFAGKSVR